MASHNFAFEGGEILTGMGASWFVSYAYYEKVDPTHKNWARFLLLSPVYPNTTRVENTTRPG